MVHGQGGPVKARPLIQRLNTAELVEAFIASRHDCLTETRRHYRQVLRRFERVHSEFPWNPGEIIRFLLELPQLPRPRWGLGVMTMRDYYKVLRSFYAWAKAERDPLLPLLPYESFGRKPRRR